MDFFGALHLKCYAENQPQPHIFSVLATVTGGVGEFCLLAANRGESAKHAQATSVTRKFVFHAQQQPL